MGARIILVPLLTTLLCFAFFIVFGENWVAFPQQEAGHLPRGGVFQQQSDENNESVSTFLEFSPNRLYSVSSTNTPSENSEDQQLETEEIKYGTVSNLENGDLSSRPLNGQIGKQTTNIDTTVWPTTSNEVDSHAVEEFERIQATGDLLPSVQSTRVNCQHLFTGKEEYPDEVKKAMLISELITLQSSDIMEVTKDCEQYRRMRGYVMHSLTREEENFPIAYSILMYTAPGQAERLLRAIYRPQNFYCIHVDIKADRSTKKSINSVSNCFDNVFVVPNPTDVYWGEFGVLEAEIICMEHLAKFKWKYFLNLTGHEFPLASNYKIVQVLRTYNGANEIANEKIKSFIRRRWRFIHVHGEGNTRKRAMKPPSNITIYKGSAHVVLSREFVDYIMNDPVPRQFLHWTRNTSCPEEIFFTSLQHNPHLKAPGSFKEYHNEYQEPISRHKVWDWTPERCSSEYFRNKLCIFGVEDLSSLYKDDHAFFINKLIDNFQPVTYDCLEELLANRTREEYLGRKKVDLDFFQQLPFVTDHF